MTRKTKKEMTLELCRGCPAKCCHNLAMWIDSPKTKEDVEDMLWKLHYDSVRIYIRNRRWYMWIKGRCIYLDDNNFCKIYDKRPQKCRDHNPPDCERYGEFWDEMFNTPEDLKRFLAKRKRAAKRRAARRNAKKASR